MLLYNLWPLIILGRWIIGPERIALTVGVWKSFSVSVSQEESRITEFEVIGILSELLFQRTVGKEESTERRGDHLFTKIKHRFVKILSYMWCYLFFVFVCSLYIKGKKTLKENAFIIGTKLLHKVVLFFF